MNWRKLILGGLLLPLRLYFQPGTFVDEVEELAPELPYRYSLWQARHNLREPKFRSHVFLLLGQFFAAQLWVLFWAFLWAQLGYTVDWGER